MSFSFPLTAAARLQNLRRYPQAILYGAFDMARRALKASTETGGTADVDFNDDTMDIKTKTIEVLRKEKSVEDGIAFLKKVSSILRQHRKLFPEFQQWIEETDEILARTERPRILVGVLGTTGCGKTSLINALLDEEKLLPSNAMRASTSVVTEISWNESDDPEQSYRAEIEFISMDEWKAEINILLSDLASAVKGGKISNKSIKPGSEASSAWAKIKAVYPQILISRLASITTETLLLEGDLAGIFGTTRQVHAQNAKTFSTAINTYIDNNNKRGNTKTMAYWPLVRCVRVYIKAEVLKHGLVLVDLPGLGDSNAGRRQIAEKYIRKLTYIWIVADIVRAIDDQIAKDLMGTSFKRQLLMDGKYDSNYVTFILSKTDIINTEEVIDSLKLAETSLKSQLLQEEKVTAEIRDMQKIISEKTAALKNLNDQIKQLDEDFKTTKPAPKRGRKRKLAEDDQKTEDSESKEPPKWTAPDLREKTQQKKNLAGDKAKAGKVVQDLKKTLFGLRATKESVGNEIKNICTQDRNHYTKDQLAVDFEDGRKEMQEDIIHDDAGGDMALHVSTQQKPNVFCVSSKGYQRLCGRFKRDPLPKAFPTLRETFIPDLQEYAASSTVSARSNIADEFLDGTKLLRLSMKSWAENDTPIALSSSKKDELDKMLARHLAILQTSCQKASHAVLAEIRKLINLDITPVINTCVEESIEKSEEICMEITRSIHFQTFKAICVRNGNFTRRNTEQIDWNDVFVGPFMEPLAAPWDKVFGRQMNDLDAGYTENMLKAFNTFTSKIETLLKLISENSATEFSDKVPIYERELTSRISRTFSVARERARDIHREVEPLIQGHIEPAYRTCTLQSYGSGALMRMKQQFAQHIQTDASVMYEESASLLATKLDKMVKDLEEYFTEIQTATTTQFKKEVQRTIMLADFSKDSKAREKIRQKMQTELQQDLAILEKAWSKSVVDPMDLPVISRGIMCSGDGDDDDDEVDSFDDQSEDLEEAIDDEDDEDEDYDDLIGDQF